MHPVLHLLLFVLFVLPALFSVMHPGSQQQRCLAFTMRLRLGTAARWSHNACAPLVQLQLVLFVLRGKVLLHC